MKWNEISVIMYANMKYAQEQHKNLEKKNPINYKLAANSFLWWCYG